MAHVTPKEEAALTEIMQVLKSQPEESTSANQVLLVTNDDNIPAQQEKLTVLVSTGKSKEAIGVQLTHEQVKCLTDKDVQKYSKRYEAYIGNKTTESLIDSFIMLYSKGVGMVVSIDDVKKLQVPRPKFDVSLPNAVHQADLLFCLMTNSHMGKRFTNTL